MEVQHKMGKTKVCLLQGNEACALGAIDAGARFYAGYPITPATEVAEEMSRLLPQCGGNFLQMEDELSCMGAIIGASLAGAKSITATSGPGFSLMQENFGYAAMVEAPCVVVDVQRGGPSTGLPTLPSQGDVMQAKWGTHGDHPVIALAPASVSEMYTLTVEAFNLAEKYRTPVLLMADAIIGHMREKVEIPADGSLKIFNRVKPEEGLEVYKPYQITKNGVPPMANMGDGYRHYISGCMHDEMGVPNMMSPKIANDLVRRLCDKIDRNRDDIVRAESTLTEDCDVLIVAYGSVGRSAASAVRDLRDKGVKAGLFRPVTLWPSPDKELLAAAKNARHVLVAEMNLGQYAGEVCRIFGEAGVAKKISTVTKVTGEIIRPEEIVKAAEQEVR